MSERVLNSLRGIGQAVVNGIWRLGYASGFFLMILLRSGVSFRRPPLTIKEIYTAGVLSLIIIVVSGLFVGMVLALQGYETLQKYGSSEAVGTLVALSLVRELGPVVAQGTPDEIRESKAPFVHQFVWGEMDGPLPFHMPGAAYANDLGLVAANV